MASRRRHSRSGRAAVDPDAGPEPQIPRWFPAAAFAVGVVFILFVLVLATVITSPSSFTQTIYRIVISMGCAGFATTLTGFIALKLKFARGITLMAGGSLAVFVIVFFWNPASGLADAPPGPGPAPTPAPPMAIVLPDEAAKAVISPNGPSRFEIEVAGAKQTIPREGLVLGEGATVSPNIMESYRASGGTGEPVRLAVRLQAGTATTAAISYDGKSCGTLAIDPGRKVVWTFRFADCK